MKKRLETFEFLQSIGGLSWVYMYLVWILGLELLNYLIIPLAVSAVLFSFLSLVYAMIRLDRTSVPLMAVIGGNLWVIADSLWAINDSQGIEILHIVAQIFTILLVVVATWEFLTSRSNFVKFFRKFRIR